MKTIYSGYGNSGDLMVARQNVLKNKLFRYATITTSGGRPGMLGGSFNFEICGTDNLKELLEPGVLRDTGSIYDTQAGKELKKSELAKLYLESLTRKARKALTVKMLVKFITGEE